MPTASGRRPGTGVSVPPPDAPRPDDRRPRGRPRAAARRPDVGRALRVRRLVAARRAGAATSATTRGAAGAWAAGEDTESGAHTGMYIVRVRARGATARSGPSPSRGRPARWIGSGRGSPGSPRRSRGRGSTPGLRPRRIPRLAAARRARSRLARPFRAAGCRRAALRGRAAGEFLDRTRLAYDITTDVALARRGPGPR